MREMSNAELDREVIRLDAKRKEPRIKLVPFDKSGWEQTDDIS